MSSNVRSWSQWKYPRSGRLCGASWKSPTPASTRMPRMHLWRLLHPSLWWSQSLSGATYTSNNRTYKPLSWIMIEVLVEKHGQPPHTFSGFTHPLSMHRFLLVYIYNVLQWQARSSRREVFLPETMHVLCCYDHEDRSCSLNQMFIPHFSPAVTGSPACNVSSSSFPCWSMLYQSIAQPEFNSAQWNWHAWVLSR